MAEKNQSIEKAKNNAKEKVFLPAVHYKLRLLIGILVRGHICSLPNLFSIMRGIWDAMEGNF